MKYIKEFKEQLNDNFYKWFGDSKMVDNQGKPQVYYHGSKHNFDTFEDDLIGMATGNEGHYGRGFYFTDKERSAEIWADPYKSGDGIIAGDEIVVFKPNQIKSIHNKGSFNPNNDNINENLI